MTAAQQRAEQPMVVASLEAYRLNQPLSEPYHLAFGSFDAFDTFLVQVETENGASAWGETTACPGYVPETGDEIWAFLCHQAAELIGSPVEKGLHTLLPFAQDEPFAVTPMATALEGLRPGQWSRLALKERTSTVVPLVGILSAADERKLEAGFRAQVEKGHATVKLKVGFDVESDCRRVLFVQKLARQVQGVRIRVDANQGYSLADASRFVQTLDPEVVELFEQPFGIGDWESQVALAPHCPVPLMLDESILGPEDVKKAAALGCASYVKFKLMKAGSRASLAELIALAGSLGLKVVLGNGVAGEIGCYHEAIAALEAGVETAGEMNGFLKVRRPLLAEPLAARQGGIEVTMGLQQMPSPARLAEMSVDQRRWC